MSLPQSAPIHHSRVGYWTRDSRAEGESLLEVVLAIGIVATLALTAAQTQIAQSRMQRALQEHIAAMALLDAMAESRRMQIGASMPATTPFKEWQAHAASTLPDGRLTVRRVSAIADRLSISWRARAPATERADGSQRCRDADPQRRCESIDVPASETGASTQALMSARRDAARGSRFGGMV